MHKRSILLLHPDMCIRRVWVPAIKLKNEPDMSITEIVILTAPSK